MGAPQSYDLNATYGRCRELIIIVRNEESIEVDGLSIRDFVGMVYMVQRLLGEELHSVTRDRCVIAKHGLCRYHGQEHVSRVRPS